MAQKGFILAGGWARLAIKAIPFLPPALRQISWQRLRPHLSKAIDDIPPPQLMENLQQQTPTKLLSSTCREADFHLPAYHEWCAQIDRPPRYHRKQWEFYFIARALRERGMLTPGKCGLGFGVGKEPLAAIFAQAGCRLLLTDMDPEEAKRHGWTASNQHASQLSDLNARNLCPDETFLAQVRFEPADMNHIPAHFRDFDFCWSSCALEHLGSIETGLKFIERSLDCLKPGGIAVHTTEFNVFSNSDTLDHAGTVLFRRRDLEQLQARLTAAGHMMEPLSLGFGDAPADFHIDMPPYKQDRHLKLAIEKWVTTSVGVIIQKQAD